jgi:hypothetical protein
MRMAIINSTKKIFRVLLAFVFGAATSAEAQSPSPVDSALPAYRPPLIVIAQPDNVAVPQDKPVIVIRFGAGEPDDPIDAHSFAVSVDGIDVTTLFQLSGGEAWGPLAAGPGELAVNNHEVVTRICSVRGTCSTSRKVIAVEKPSVAVAPPPPLQSASRKKRVIDALLGALRSLLGQ